MPENKDIFHQFLYYKAKKYVRSSGKTGEVTDDSVGN